MKACKGADLLKAAKAQEKMCPGHKAVSTEA